MITIDIDTGGTMTDCLVSDVQDRHSIKVDTTAHDYTVSFLQCLEKAAEIYEEDSVEKFLRGVELIRWSSTITTNVLAERRGAKVGLLVSEGHENDLYGDGDSVCVGEIVAPENIIGLKNNPDAGMILSAVKDLLETGARRICISLKDSFPDNSNEIAVKDIIEDQYPDHILGSVPVLLGSDMAPVRHDQTRAHYSLMNAYTHMRLASSLFKAEDLLRDNHRWNGALLIGHTSGGVARVGKTKAVDTIESGPIFGTFGGAFMAREYGLKQVACFDVGGTTTKASVVMDGEPVFQRGGDLMEIPVETSFAMLRSAAIGGGSVARCEGGNLTLGPDSMGAAPGPACYGLGGQEATITDALLVLGYLDPERFLGGRRVLDVTKASEAIDRAIGVPMGVSTVQAAALICEEASEVMASLVRNTLAEAKADGDDTSLFCFGGNGPMFGGFIGEKLGISSVYAFDLGPVFSAFGSAQSDVSHVYERGYGKSASSELFDMVADMDAQARRDLEGEGFDPNNAEYLYEFELGKGGDVPCLELSGAPAGDLAEQVEAALQSKGEILLVRLKSRFAISSHGVAKLPEGKATSTPVTRNISFGGTLVPTDCYLWEDLVVGQSIVGPAVVNGETLTCPIPPGWQLDIDSYGNAVLSQ
tara:strand:+ start:54628 stop:56562 length:1935 start_codon:yes stop_codon:yes gene_type:complete